jgi:hypothetical protein
MLRRRIDGAETVSEQVRHLDGFDGAGRAGKEPSSGEAAYSAWESVMASCAGARGKSLPVAPIAHSWIQRV